VFKSIVITQDIIAEEEVHVGDNVKIGFALLLRFNWTTSAFPMIFTFMGGSVFPSLWEAVFEMDSSPSPSDILDRIST
jgi:hypothetical protein